MLGSPLLMILGLVDFISIFQNEGKKGEIQPRDVYRGGFGFDYFGLLVYYIGGGGLFGVYFLLTLFFSRRSILRGNPFN